MLGEQGRITELANPRERIKAIAKDYAAKPENTIIVSPDNRSRQLINQAVRGVLEKISLSDLIHPLELTSIRDARGRIVPAIASGRIQ